MCPTTYSLQGILNLPLIVQNAKKQIIWSILDSCSLGYGYSQSMWDAAIPLSWQCIHILGKQVLKNNHPAATSQYIL